MCFVPQFVVSSNKAAPITICSFEYAGGVLYAKDMKEQPPANRIQVGQTVYLIVSCIRIREAIVRRFDYGLYTIQFIGTKGGIRIKGDRLYTSQQEAEKHLRKNEPQPQTAFRYDGKWHNVPLWMC